MSAMVYDNIKGHPNYVNICSYKNVADIITMLVCNACASTNLVT